MGELFLSLWFPVLMELVCGATRLWVAGVMGEVPRRLLTTGITGTTSGSESFGTRRTSPVCMVDGLIPD